MTRQTVIWVLLFVLGGVRAWGAEPVDLTARGITEFRSAYQAWDGPGLAQAAETLAQAADAAPASVTNHYWSAVAQFHRVLYLEGLPAHATNRQAATAALQRCVNALTTAVKLDPRHAESQALLSSVYGLSIGANPARALWLGPRLKEAEKQARRLAPQNPRVLLLLGMNRFYGPALLGGKREALQLLLAAEKAFVVEEQAAPTDPLAPRWGHGSCLVYLAKTHDALGQSELAAQALAKALARDPTDKLAQAEAARRKK